MTEVELKKLRGHYHSLLNYQQVLESIVETNRQVIDRGSMRALANELYSTMADLPGGLPPFMEDDFREPGEDWYRISGLRGYLALALGKLTAAIEVQDSTPVTEAREFSFIKDGGLRKVIERDYTEIQKAYIGGCWKSVIILSGGAIEAVLLDLLLQNQRNTQAASKAPKNSDITRWDLSDLIKVSVELNLVSAGVEKLSHSVREYRNLIHPGNEVRNKLSFDAEEARIALEVLHIVYRDLHP
jgi:hypothetical protein